MRALILSVFVLIATSTVAQRYSVGAAVAYGSEVETIGYHARAYYNVGHKICFGPEFTYFPTTTHSIDNEEVEVSLTEANFNGHYIFHLGEKGLGIYPVGGLNWSREEEENIVHDAFGLNIGAGLHYTKNKLTFFTEFIHLTGELSEQTALIGVFYTPSKKTTTHHE